jgi:hypothetical protein
VSAITPSNKSTDDGGSDTPVDVGVTEYVPEKSPLNVLSCQVSLGNRNSMKKSMFSLLKVPILEKLLLKRS